ncbi:MAG: L-ribulose-5-phosphate 4-epimerase [Actinobacteria bacterium]|nr:L-ribulose-5-phosphate 4-epimerase [Actinomycetota bacterium]
MKDLELLREEVFLSNLLLNEYKLVTLTYGNVSGRDSKTGYIFIKPSGVDYNKLRPKDLVLVDIEGNIIDGELRPSVDLPIHLYLYKNLPEVNGVVHTHSNYATAFATIGKSIPVCLTSIADHFGDIIPCSRYASHEYYDTGEAIIEARTKSPVVLVKNHGVFTFDKSPSKALNDAVIVEDIAKTYHIALQVGVPENLTKEEIKKRWSRYQTTYGQY